MTKQIIKTGVCKTNQKLSLITAWHLDILVFSPAARSRNSAPPLQPHAHRRYGDCDATRPGCWHLCRRTASHRDNGAAFRLHYPVWFCTCLQVCRPHVRPGREERTSSYDEKPTQVWVRKISPLSSRHPSLHAVCEEQKKTKKKTGCYWRWREERMRFEVGSHT